MTRTRFICIGGKAQEGKTTTARFLKEALIEKGYKVLIIHFADLLKFICTTCFDWNGVKDEYGRTMLQNVGTDRVRCQCLNYWVDFVVDLADLFPDEWDFIIVPDARFPNEITRIDERGYDVTYVKVRRPGFGSLLTPEQQQHPSEVALDGVIPDFLLINRTLDQLKQDIQHLADTIISKETGFCQDISIFDGTDCDNCKDRLAKEEKG